MEVTKWLKPSESVSRIGDSASVQAVTRVNAEQALYEAFEVKHYLMAFFTFFIPVSLFDLESRFFAPTHECWKPARAGTVKAGRRSALASRSIVSRPRLQSRARRHARCGRDDASEGSSLSGHEELAPQPCIR